MSVLYTTIQKLDFFPQEMYTFIHQGCIKLIKSDSEDIYNVTKDFYFK